MAPPPDAQGEYYKVLGVAFDASPEDIRQRYHELVKTLHPDRRRPGTGGETLERFHQVQSAWGCLSDPTRRLLYDLRNFGYSTQGSLEKGDATRHEAGEAKLLELQKEQAARDIVNMEVQLQKVMRREKASKGIMVKQASYGDLRLRRESLGVGLGGMRTIEVQDVVGPVVDVVAPLQCLVEQHTIVLPGGASSSKADLPGFYNPAPLDTEVELSLYVLYEFRGRLHEVFVADRETLSLPMRKHAVPAARMPRGPFSPSNVALLAQWQDEGSGAGGGALGGSAMGSPRAAGAAVRAGRRRAGTLRSSNALAVAVREYRMRRLRPPVLDACEASTFEFKVVAMTAGVALAIATLRAAFCQSSK